MKWTAAFSIQAATLTFVLVGLSVWRHLCRRTCAKLCKHCKNYLQEVSGDRCYYAILIFLQWWSLLGIVLVADLITTCVTAFGNLSRATGIMGRSWLESLAMGVFPGCILTFILVIVAIVQQLRAARKETWHNNQIWMLPYARDVALQVLFMPAVYHLMMCRSVMRQYSVLTGERIFDTSWLDVREDVRREMELQVSEADNSVAEMYDAYALVCFGSLALTFVKTEFEQRISEEREHHRRMHEVLTSSIMMGVWMYALTTLVSSLYSISITMTTVSLNRPVCVQDHFTNTTTNTTEIAPAVKRDSGYCLFNSMIYGADMATSTIAIYNLVYFETKLHPEIKSFHPGLKFWSMKLPITLAFSISFLKLLQPITKLENEEVDLLNTCVKAYCMMLTACFNIRAWRPFEEWYNRLDLRDDTDFPNITPDLDEAETETDSADESEERGADEEQGGDAVPAWHEAAQDDQNTAGQELLSPQIAVSSPGAAGTSTPHVATPSQLAFWNAEAEVQKPSESGFWRFWTFQKK